MSFCGRNRVYRASPASIRRLSLHLVHTAECFPGKTQLIVDFRSYRKIVANFSAMKIIFTSFK